MTYENSVVIDIVIRHRTTGQDVARVKANLGEYMRLGRNGGFVEVENRTYTCVHYSRVNEEDILWVEG